MARNKRICRKCKTPLIKGINCYESFYEIRNNICKKCNNEYTKIYKRNARINNIGYFKRQLKILKNYFKTDRGKEVLNKADRKSKLKYPEKNKARIILRYAVKIGKVKRGNCVSVFSDICKGKVEAHHPDYSKPLEVMWLCRKHHSNLHYLNEHDQNRRNT